MQPKDFKDWLNEIAKNKTIQITMHTVDDGDEELLDPIEDEEEIEEEIPLPKKSNKIKSIKTEIEPIVIDLEKIWKPLSTGKKHKKKR